MDEIISTLIQYKQLDNVTNQYHDSWEFHDIARNNLKLYFEQMKVIKPKYFCAIASNASRLNVVFA